MLTEEGKIVAKDIAERLGLSDDSVRRDLRELATERLCQRVYGGALPASPALADYATRQQVAPASKHCTVITQSPTIATTLVEHPTAEAFLLGGKIFKHSAVACGSAAVEAAQQISADLCLLGVTGVHPEVGLTTGDPDEAAMKRALAARAADTYVLASTEKIGAASRYRVLPWDEISGLVMRGLELILTADPITAGREVEIGLVNAVLPATDLLDSAHDLAGRITRHSPTAVAACLRAVTRGINLPIDEGLAVEAAWFSASVTSDGVRESLDRFLHRRERSAGPESAAERVQPQGMSAKSQELDVNHS